MDLNKMELTNELIDFARNCGISYYKINNFFRLLEIEDIVSESYLCLILCSKTFNGDGEFKGYFSQRLWWHLNLICKELLNKYNKECELKEDIMIQDDRIVLEDKIINDIINNDIFTDPSLTVEQVDILYRLGIGETQKSIAQTYKVGHRSIAYQLAEIKRKLNYYWVFIEDRPERIKESDLNTRKSKLGRK
jgi:hypothetical protein